MTRALFFIILLFIAPTMASACSVSKVRGSDKVIDPSRIDGKLMSKAILAYTNQARCKAGLSAMKYDGALTKAATVHSGWMAKAQTVSHTQNNNSQRDLATRLKKARATFKVTAAENISRTARMNLPSGRFGIKDASTCHFTYSNGKQVPPHTYDSLAKTLVSQWVASPSHYANIVIKPLKRHGGMVGFDPKSQYCGNFYATQVFAG